MEKLIIKRVAYGKESTPVDLREYVLVGIPNCPVGTLKDWEDYASQHGYDEVRIISNQKKGQKI